MSGRGDPAAKTAAPVDDLTPLLFDGDEESNTGDPSADMPAPDMPETPAATLPATAALRRHICWRRTVVAIIYRDGGKNEPFCVFPSVAALLRNYGITEKIPQSGALAGRGSKRSGASCATTASRSGR